jgi:hypothetical protein
MSYALGMELAADAVRVVTMSNADAYDGPVEVDPPVLYCEDGSTWVGVAAEHKGTARPQSLVQDIVGEFTVDRLFLTGGRMLSTDDALFELIGGIVADLGLRRAESPLAVTISCPILWDPTTQARVAAIADGLGLGRPRIIVGEDCTVAADDAFTRMPRPVAGPTPDSLPRDLPRTESSLRRQAVVARPDAPMQPRAPKVRSSRWAVIGSVVAVAALVAMLGAVLLRNQAPVNPSPTPVSNPSPTSTASPTAAGSGGFNVVDGALLRSRSLEVIHV